MENKIDLEYSTHFVIDYRSLPSGIGTIFYPSGDTILVTESGSGPKDMEGAKKAIREEHLPSSVDYIPFSMGEHWEAGQAALEAILKTHNVQYVVDSELASQVQLEYGNISFVENSSQNLFTLVNWIKCRSL